MQEPPDTRSRGVGRLVPIVDWLPRYDRAMLRGDVLAGLAVTAMIVPKDLGYAGIAGVPVQNGLYAAAAGAIVYALFCTSRHISTGPSSSLAAVAGGAVLFTGVGGADAAELVAAITLVTGALFLLLALLRLGWIARFLSRAVVTGFLAGAAIDVVVGELPKLTGTSDSGDNVWQELGSWLRTLGDVSWTTLLVGAAGAGGSSSACASSRPASRAPSCSWSAGLLATRLFDLGAHGVALVGPVPRGLPAPMLPGRRRLPAALLDDPRGRGGAAPDRLLADGRRRARVRRPPPLPHRRQPGVGRAGDGERGLRRLPGDAGLDEPLRELAQRVGRARAPRWRPSPPAGS